MKQISANQITEAVSQLCVQANKVLPTDVSSAIFSAQQTESNLLAKAVLGDLCENIEIAKQRSLPVCQDTGMAVIFLDIGQAVQITDGDLYTAVNAGVSDGYTKGYLRASIVSDPLRRVNTSDNTPAVIHTNIVPGDTLSITVCPKGFGSENMSQLTMLTPSATRQDIIDFVVRVVKQAGSNPCPPIIVGVGIGGNFESVAYLAKTALLRPLDCCNTDAFYADLESEMLCAINALKIGASGFGGDVTALKVAINAAPTHIAGLPLAVNIGCHVSRHAKIIL